MTWKENLLIALITAFVPSLFAYYNLCVQRQMEIKKEKLFGFYLLALKKLNKYLYKDPNTSEVQKVFEEIFEFSKQQEHLLENNTKCAICKFKIACSSEKPEDTWVLCNKCKLEHLFDKEKCYTDLCLEIKMNSLYLKKFINLSNTIIHPSNFNEFKWIWIKRFKTVGAFLFLYIFILLIISLTLFGFSFIG